MADDIREEVADWIVGVVVAGGQPKDGVLAIDAYSFADALLASPVIARIRAEAWDEGDRAGLHNAVNATRLDFVMALNPYRPYHLAHRLQPADDHPAQTHHQEADRA